MFTYVKENLKQLFGNITNWLLADIQNVKLVGQILSNTVTFGMIGVLLFFLYRLGLELRQQEEIQITFEVIIDTILVICLLFMTVLLFYIKKQLKSKFLDDEKSN